VLAVEERAAVVEVRGGARLDLAVATWPFARLTIAAETVTLKVVGAKPLTFSTADQLTICEVRGIPFFSTGLLIRHARPEYPKRIFFGVLSWSSAWVVDLFEQRGYLVERSAVGRGRQ
jgi:hypothetical protein